MERKWWTLTAVAAGVFMLLLDITIVNVALPGIQHQLGGSLSDLQWVIDAYALSLAALLLTAGSLADLIGRRIVFAIGIGIFTAGSLLCGVAQSPTFLALARAGQGIGGSIMFATSLALLANSFRGSDRGIAFGVWGAIAGIAVAVGPVVGGALVSGLGWRWIFFVNVPIGVVTLAITLLRVEESRDPHASRPDLLGFATFSTALLALVYGLIKSSTHGWASHLVIGSIVTGAGLMHVFPDRRVAPAPPDARSEPAPRADVRRRPDFGLRDLGLAVLGPDLPDPLPPERAGIPRSAPVCGCWRSPAQCLSRPRSRAASAHTCPRGF